MFDKFCIHNHCKWAEVADLWETGLRRVRRSFVEGFGCCRVVVCGEWGDMVVNDGCGGRDGVLQII